MIDLLGLIGFQKATEYEFKAELSVFIYYLYVKRPGKRVWEKCLDSYGDFATCSDPMEAAALINKWSKNIKGFEYEQNKNMEVFIKNKNQQQTIYSKGQRKDE